ncbi:zinc ribbon domain-containing protein [Bacillus atrophaeus]|uniref:zinc ribbon domain-containing protein n=1 Tax=Bacillus atrophaeus TaxID=1452 RepID=UPI00227DA37D|nr:zinc ribbon domain-containing protein [Bacillus atrophaeus]MCY8513651.1 zinc ribbon domain-containing protein [Bacillus atrophaeus]MCY8990089.1 zinc ribbon domain-containing protein [Bacillus atrophaeus]
MYCPQCGHQTDGGKFCEKCGSPLPQQTGESQISGQAAQAGAAAKQASMQFVSFVLRILKRPYQECKTTGGEQLVRSIITMILFSLLTPLMFYILLSSGSSTVSFTEIVIKPAFYFALFIFFLHGLIFLALKAAGLPVSFKDSISRFGAFLIPFTAILLLALLLFLLHTDMCFTILAVGLLGAFFAVPPAMLCSYQHSYTGKVDIVYSTIVIYLMICVTIQLTIEHYTKALFNSLFF